MKINFKRYGLYLLRWQLSTPILAWCVIVFAMLGPTLATVIANLVGGLIFFWVDKLIFQSDTLDSSWQIKEKVKCADCQNIARGYRLVKSKNYDKSHDKHPEFRCESCSTIKFNKMEMKDLSLSIII